VDQAGLGLGCGKATVPSKAPDRVPGEALHVSGRCDLGEANGRTAKRGGRRSGSKHRPEVRRVLWRHLVGSPSREGVWAGYNTF
jgi:hypothetical protein